MSKADKIYDIAEKLGYEGDTEGSTSDAINAVSDALGFVGPHEKRITSALADLYTVVDGGGGGGSVGGLGTLIGSTQTPSAGGQFYGASIPVAKAYVGSSCVWENLSNPLNGFARFASGMTIDTGKYAAAYVVSLNAFIVELDMNTYKWTSVEQFDGITFTPHQTTMDDDSEGIYWTFTMPEVPEGKMLCLSPYGGN